MWVEERPKKYNWQWPIPPPQYKSGGPLLGIIIRIIFTLGPYVLPQTLLKWETQLPGGWQQARSLLKIYCLSLGNSLIRQLIKCQLVLTWVYLRIILFLWSFRVLFDISLVGQICWWFSGLHVGTEGFVCFLEFLSDPNKYSIPNKSGMGVGWGA